MVPLEDLKPHPKNPNKHPKEQIEAIAESIRRFKFSGRLISWRGFVIVGNGALEAAKLAGLGPKSKVPVMDASDLSEKEAMALMVADNEIARGSEPQDKLIASLLKEHDLRTLPGFQNQRLSQMIASLAFERRPEAKGALADRYQVPPFSILDARMAGWRKRRAQWLSLGAKEAKGRKENLKKGARVWQSITTSTYDPVLAEVLIRWFSPEKGTILDPFAGDLAPGLVAQELGRNFLGVELRKEQVEENQKAVDARKATGNAKYIQGASQDALEFFSRDLKFDFLFSCPPYADLEVYSKDPRDLSRMDYPKFCGALRNVFAQAFKLLTLDSFACITIGEVREKNEAGYYHGLVADTVKAMQEAGFKFYNELIFISPLGSMPLRAARPFEGSRKCLKAHQNVLVFVKGDPKKATKKCGEIKVGELNGFE
jgi:DNA modification methylase